MTASPSPITPTQASAAKADLLPGFVTEAFNELITARLHNGRAEFTQDEVVERICSKALQAGQAATRAQVFERHWLDVEPRYRAAGWKVECDRPAYNESYAARYFFTT